MPTCAVVDTETGRVLNTIVANAADGIASPGTMLVDVPDGASIDARWIWDADKACFAPGPELKAELDAAAVVLAADAFEV